MVTELESEIVALSEKRTKSEMSAQKLKNLSSELHKKLEEYLMESKRLRIHSVDCGSLVCSLLVLVVQDSVGGAPEKRSSVRRVCC
jgi:hypothetical protein